jgi:hypothetical protein
VCARGGSSHIYVVYTSNGNGVEQTGSTSTRYRVVSTFVTSPYVEQGATKNPPTSGSGGTGGTGGTGGSGGSGTLDLTQQQIIDQVKQLMPSRCKFGNQWISINGSGSDTIQQRYGSVPICVIEQNFKEW